MIKTTTEGGRVAHEERHSTMETLQEFEERERTLYTERMGPNPGQHSHEHLLNEHFHHNADEVIAWIVIVLCVGAVFTILICFTRKCPTEVRPRRPWATGAPDAEDERHLTDNDMELDVQEL